jgi:HTH-type transcriptional regulator/antitoxin HipB
VNSKWEQFRWVNEWILQIITEDSSQRNNYGRETQSRLAEEEHMSDLQKYINDRRQKDPEFSFNYDSEYQNFKIGALLKQARIEKGMTQEELAEKLHTKKSAISRIENHAEDIRLSTIEKYARALDQKIRIVIE